MKKTYFQNNHDKGIIVTNSPETWISDPHYTRLSNTKGKELRQEECRRELAKMIKPGDTLYTVLRHVSGSGMQRRIDVYKMVKTNPATYRLMWPTCSIDPYTPRAG